MLYRTITAERQPVSQKRPEHGRGRHILKKTLVRVCLKGQQITLAANVSDRHGMFASIPRKQDVKIQHLLFTQRLATPP
ncbi:hypothetical protein AD948_10175 [Acetobacter senegalensis]|uniref:Uncharacterized protein n=1 Tax=Acetobacter senegalensis TaxID=446692 RepID=A0A149U0H9_9PROT|nr:hypothetical protein AD948_10175 [Acetobacter senegalensis]